jgi:hypothetical protein
MGLLPKASLPGETARAEVGPAAHAWTSKLYYTILVAPRRSGCRIAASGGFGDREWRTIISEMSIRLPPSFLIVFGPRFKHADLGIEAVILSLRIIRETDAADCILGAHDLFGDARLPPVAFVGG